MTKFVAFYTQKTKRGLKNKKMELTAKNRQRAWHDVHQMLPRHSSLGNVYVKGSEAHKLAERNAPIEDWVAISKNAWLITIEA